MGGSSPSTPGAFLHPFSRPARESFHPIVRGEGAAIFDAEGKRYVDAVAGLWFCQIGHGRREMAEAMAEQASRLAAYHCFEPFTNDRADALAERLTTLAPMPGARVFFTSSGSEAVDTAIKLAQHTHALRGDAGRTLVVRRNAAYHGTAFGGTTAQGIAPNRALFGPLLPNFVEVDHGDVAALEALFAARGDEIAAFLVEPLQGAGGVYPPTPGYLEAARRLCDEAGALLIMDEVITGFGRFGQYFASLHYGVEPDLVTFAKGVTSGYVPLGGVLVGGRVREALESDPTRVLRHGFTYSGHPVACAAALTNLHILEEESLLSRALLVGEKLHAGLAMVLERDEVTELRGEGAVYAVELREGVDAYEVRDRMMARGVIPRPLGSRVLAFCPPLVIEDADITLTVDVLATSLAG